MHFWAEKLVHDSNVLFRYKNVFEIKYCDQFYSSPRLSCSGTKFVSGLRGNY